MTGEGARRRPPRSLRSRHAVRAAQRGLSLVELMIAVLLGLVIIAAVYNMYTGTVRSSRFTSGLQSMQENGRFGVSVLQKGFRLAGYSPANPLEAFDVAASGPGRVVVRLRQAYDCNGRSTAATDGIAVNTYEHDAAARRIVCTGNSADASAMPIVEDVDGFRVLYGIDDDDDDVPERFEPHSATLDARRIAALRFALLVSSDGPIRTAAVAEKHVLLDQVIDEYDDRVARTVFASTVKLRNRR